MLVQEFLEHSADRTPQKVALICGGQRLTYAHVEAQSNCLANALRQQGLNRGERIVFLLSNSVELVIGIFATLKAGGVFVVVNPTTKADKLTYILNNCEATVLVTSERYVKWTESLRVQVPSLRLVVVDSLQGSTVTPGRSFQELCVLGSPERPGKASGSLDLACLVYTSGSTGDPKGVMSDHGNVDFVTDSIVSYLKNVPDDIVINVLPLSFDYGLYQLLMTFKFGGTLVLEKGFTFPAAILKRMEEERVTGFPGVPTMFAVLLNMDLSAFDLSSLRYITNTAAALAPSHIAQIRTKFPQAALYSMYGLTETKRTLYLPPGQLDRRPGSVGIAIPGTEVWVEDEAGRRLGPGETGELVVRGPHVMRGYWGDPATTARRFRPGPIPGERLCYTGDLFRMDDEGYFYFVGRKDDVIKSRGEKVSPKEVENVLYELDGVMEAAVVGVPDPVMGEAIKAYVVAKNGHLTKGAVIQHCRARLEDLMVPQYIEFCRELPKTTSGKIRKTDLK